MSALTGAVTLTRFALRRDRSRLLAWVGGIAVLVVGAAASVKGLYPTQRELDEAAGLAEDNATAIAFNGPAQALDTEGGQVAFQIGSFGLAVVALMAVFTVGRLTRAEEEEGRTELIRALPVGRFAPLAAALAVGALASVAVGALVALGLVAQGLPAGGSAVFGASFGGLGLVFTGLTLVAAQASENTRAVHGMAGALVGAAYVVRAVGDIGDGTVSWLSPIGWAQKTRPYAGEVLWPLLVSLAVTAVAVLVAARLSARRDVGAGLVAPRRGRPAAAPSLGTPLGLAVRLQRGSVVGWSVGMLLLGLSFGSVADQVEDFVEGNDAVADLIARGGADVTDSFLATSLLMLSLIAAGFGVGATARLRAEEAALRAEPVLAGPVSRRRWAAGHLAVATVGTLVVLAAAGLGVGLAYGVTAGDPGQVPRLTAAALAYAPAVWVLVALTAVLFAAAPRLVAGAWAVVGVCVLVGFFGTTFDFPRWFLRLSPFEHVPLVPADGPDALPLAVLTALATAALAVADRALVARDIG